MSRQINQFFSQKVDVDLQLIPAELFWEGAEKSSLNDLMISVLREDRMFPELEGNKFRKLKYHLKAIRKQDVILSVAGPYSNHLHALAVATKLFGLNTKVLIRSGTIKSTPTTVFALKRGIELHYIDPSSFRKRYNEDQHKAWLIEYGADYFIPEGGGGDKGVEACTEILANPNLDLSKITHICCAAGSGTMLAGMAKYIAKHAPNCTLIGISAVKQTKHLEEMLQKYAPDILAKERVQLIADTDFKGFGRWDDRLLNLIKTYDAFGLPLEQIYTAKMMWYLREFVQSEFENGAKPMNVLCIHSGGLQGRCGLVSKRPDMDEV
jgi:1-aminocyclopropane-1-carboxylate deaminase